MMVQGMDRVVTNAIITNQTQDNNNGKVTVTEKRSVNITTSKSSKRMTSTSSSKRVWQI